MIKTGNEIALDLLDSPFKTERERIKYYSNKFKNKSITEAFSEIYEINLKDYDESEPNTIFGLNDVIKVKLLGVDKTSINYDNTNFKSNLQFANDLTKLPAFVGENVKYPKTIDFKVVGIKPNNTYVVDCLASAYDSFIGKFKGENYKHQFSANVKDVKPYTISNLKLTGGGYQGDLEVDSLTDITGKKTTVKAFIPGSQIVANIESDFNRWIGKSVQCFVTTIVDSKSSNDISIICSRKSYLKHLGNLNTIDLFKKYTEQGKEWEELTKESHAGYVTGVINTSKKCGIFVEIPKLNITTLVAKQPNELTNYKPEQLVSVKLTSFEEQTSTNDMGMTIHQDPYTIENGIVTNITVRPIFEEVK